MAPDMNRRLADSFARAAGSYDEAAVLARETGRRMEERLEYIRLAPSHMADVGCATGDGIRALQRRYPAALPVAVDLALPMLQQLQTHAPLWQRLSRRLPRPLCADVQALPLASGSQSLLWSNLMLHWLDDPRQAFAEMQRVLKVDGLLMFAMFGPDTLKELRTACLACGVEPPLRSFLDMHDVGDMLLDAGFADPVMDMEMLTLTYTSPRTLLRDQRALGCRNALLGDLSWRDWRRVLRQYAGMSSAENRVPASFEIIYGHAWKPEPRQIADGRAIIRFDRKPTASS
ncbi:MAG: methyltransferase domain-containing protein [Sterolibacterium sp.]|nr:methyltransferase domain-containing protein [Sterolibacterium sp.]